MYKIKELPTSERPRERALKYGVNNLSTQELLAILLRTGTKEDNALDLSMHILKSITNLNEFNTMTINELKKIRGIGSVKAITLLASIELGKRILNPINENKILVNSPNSVYHYLKDELMFKKQEHFICLYVDTKGKIIRKETLYIGTLNSTVIHPREVFNLGIKYSAAGIVLIHNHPSGDPYPSSNDKDVTNNIIDASKILGIDIIDHIIFGKGKYFSFMENGLM